MFAALAVLAVVLLGWWFWFFAHQGDRLVNLLEERGVALTAPQEGVLRESIDSSTRMLVFEGAFLALLLLASASLVVAALAREVQLVREQKHFLSAVTHELRSPIASARLAVESLLLDRVPANKRERYLTNARDDLDRLRAGVDRLLATARLSEGQPALDLRELDLASSVRELVAERLADHPGERGSVRFVGSESVAVRADREALRGIVDNLVSNALKYGGPDPQVDVEVRRADGRAVLAVRDRGPGLQGADPQRIFDAFARGDAARAEARPGVGLGLFLIAELARGHGGSAHAENAAGGGARFEVRLPLHDGGSA